MVLLCKELPKETGEIANEKAGMITIDDALNAFGLDPQTKVILLYLESIKNGRRLPSLIP